MGFYAPAQIIRDAHAHGVPVLAIDVNHSHWDCTLEESDQPAPCLAASFSEPSPDNAPQRWGAAGPAIRLGMRLIKGLPEAQVTGLVESRAMGSFRSVSDLAHRTG